MALIVSQRKTFQVSVDSFVQDSNFVRFVDIFPQPVE